MYVCMYVCIHMHNASQNLMPKSQSTCNLKPFAPQLNPWFSSEASLYYRAGSVKNWNMSLRHLEGERKKSKRNDRLTDSLGANFLETPKSLAQGDRVPA